MATRRKLTAVAAAVLAAGAVVPAGVAQAAPGHEGGAPGIGQRANPEAWAAYRAAVRQAVKTRNAAVKAANQAFLADTAEARATLKTALKNATTRAERRAAHAAYKAATVDARATRRQAIRTAQTEFRAAMKAARDALKAALAA